MVAGSLVQAGRQYSMDGATLYAYIGSTSL